MLSFAQRAIRAACEGRVMFALRNRLDRDRRSYLRNCKGVIHVGANDGAERQEYASLGLQVLWVEPLPDPFMRLQRNIATLPGQEAVQALIADREGEACTLNVSSDAGRCSSILEPEIISELLPTLKLVRQLAVTSETLESVLRGRDASLYDALVVDTQGSELRVFEGGAAVLRNFKYIECEGANFALYKYYPSPGAIRSHLAKHGFEQIRQDIFKRSRHGTEFDMLFRRR